VCLPQAAVSRILVTTLHDKAYQSRVNAHPDYMVYENLVSLLKNPLQGTALGT